MYTPHRTALKNLVLNKSSGHPRLQSFTRLQISGKGSRLANSFAEMRMDWQVWCCLVVNGIVGNVAGDAIVYRIAASFSGAAISAAEGTD